MKKTALFLALLLTMGMAGCGAQEEETGSDNAGETAQETQEETEALTVDAESKTITVQATAT